MGGGSEVTIGYKYYLGMHMVVCLSPKDNPVESLNGVFAGERSLDVSASVNGSYFVNKPDLFGGEQKEGGVQGYIDVEFGGPTQGQNSYLVSRINSGIPSFRGVLGVVLRKPLLSSMTPYFKPWSFRVTRRPARNWNAATAEPTAGSANGVHIIYECITDAEYGLGMSSFYIDDASFTAAAQILFDEGLGLSLLFSKQSTIKDFIEIILSHINGVMYTSRQTGKFVLKLIRESSPAEIAAASSFTEDDDCKIMMFRRANYAELVNEVVVKFRPQGAREDSSVTVQDLASMQSQDGSIISQTVSFAGIDNKANAIKVGLRELRRRSAPLAQVTVQTNRKGWSVSPGDIIKVTSARFGFTDLVIRVFSVSYGGLQDGTVTIEGTEDIYSLPTTTFTGDQVSGWVDPIVAPIALTNELAIEMPYYELENRLQTFELEEVQDNSGYGFALGLSPETVATINFDLQTRLSPAAYELAGTGSLSEYVVISSTLAKEESASVVSTTFFSTGMADVAIGSWGIFDDTEEIVRLDAVDVNLAQVTISRGCLDTTPQAHIAGARIYWAEGAGARDLTEYSIGETLHLKLLPRTSLGVLDEPSATQLVLPINARQARPYLPGQITFSSSYYPVRQAAENGIVLNWSHRDRLLSVNNLVAFDEAGTGAPETNTTYGVRVLGEATNQIAAFAGIEGTSFNYTLSDEIINSNLPESQSDQLFLTDTGLAVSTLPSASVVQDPFTPYTSIRPFSKGKWFRVGVNFCHMQQVSPSAIQQSAASDADVNNIEFRHINRATGALNLAVLTDSAMRDSQLNNNPYGVKATAPINPDTPTDWSVVKDSTIVSAIHTDVLDASMNTLFPVHDYRDSPTYSYFLTCQLVSSFATVSPTQPGYEDRLLHDLIFEAVAGGGKKRIRYEQRNVCRILNSTLSSGSTVSVVPSLVTFSEYFTAQSDFLNDGLADSLDHVGFDDAYIGANSVKTPDSVASIDHEPFYSARAFGEAMIVVFKDWSGAPMDTTGRTLDITNLITSHFTASSTIKLYNSERIRTARFSINGTGTLTLEDTLDGWYDVHRSNVADTEGIQWNRATGSFDVISTEQVTFGNVVSSGSYSGQPSIKAMAVDWVNSEIFVLRTDGRVAKLNYSGTELALTTNPITAMFGTAGVMSPRIEVSDNFVYVNEYIAITKSLTDSSFLPIAGVGISGGEVTLASELSFGAHHKADDDIFVYRDYGQRLLQEQTTQTQSSLLNYRGNSPITVEVIAERAGLNSHQTFTHSFTRTGYGYAYGDSYGG